MPPGISQVTIDIRHGDALALAADVLALKHAQGLFGVDLKVFQRLSARDVRLQQALPPPGGSLLVPSRESVAAADVLFIGVEPLGQFDYESIRRFSRVVLSTLQVSRPDTRHVAMTLHGVGFGLDEAEAFRAEVAGLLDALEAQAMPPALERVTIVERDPGSAERLTALLESLLPSTGRQGHPDATREQRRDARAGLDDVGRQSRAKPHVFVAMPFADKYGDRFHYGIRTAANAAGFLCERADLASFTGDVLAWVKERIGSAALVVADLSTANPNVYLEVGYAWGRGVDTVLIVAAGDELKFDVSTQRCLMFTSIRHLEELLTKELTALAERRGMGQRTVPGETGLP
jgi:hypothetical protein